MEKKDLILNETTAKLVNDWSNLPNGSFCSIRYKKVDTRKAAQGAYVIATYSGIQKADFAAYQKVQQSIAIVGELNNPTRCNEVAIDDVKCLFYNMKQDTTKILVPGASIKCTKKEFFVPSAEGGFKEVSQDEYDKYLSSCGLTTGTAKKPAPKRGIDCRQFLINRILGINDIVYAQ